MSTKIATVFGRINPKNLFKKSPRDEEPSVENGTVLPTEERKIKRKRKESVFIIRE